MTADSQAPPVALAPDGDWHLQLFRRSVLKQAKLREIRSMLGPPEGRRCLDLGSDNGVVSWHLRRAGGEWSSADLTEESVTSIRSLVGERVYRTDGRTLPFPDTSLDAVIIVDMLEHVDDDRGLLAECARVLKRGGELLVNTPHAKRHSLLRPVRHAVGLTDAWHGHVRPGYTLESLAGVLPPELEITDHRTYSRFFSESIDTAINLALTRGAGKESSDKGVVVTGADLAKRKRSFRLYSLAYPALKAFSSLDALLFFTRGYMLIARARRR